MWGDDDVLHYTIVVFPQPCECTANHQCTLEVGELYGMGIIFQQGWSKTQRVMFPLELYAPHSGPPQVPEQALSSQALGAEGNKCHSLPLKTARAKTEGMAEKRLTELPSKTMTQILLRSANQQPAFFTTKPVLATEFISS